ncbi:hypothetical protein KY284_000876 [Solanum tuberosum]|nr:hypothetical protein KY284_000876 [Solanum tuberosum]
MRKQFLASGGALPLSTGESRKDATKRPIYQSKKSKAQAWANDKAQEESVESTKVQENQLEIVSEVDSMETEKAEDIDSVSVEEKSEVVDAEENRVEEEDIKEEWDARSWDDADLKLPGKSAIEDEKLDSDPQSIIQKAARSVVSDTGPLHVAAKSVIPTQKTVASVPAVTKNDGSKKREPEVVVSGQGTENLVLLQARVKTTFGLLFAVSWVMLILVKHSFLTAYEALMFKKVKLEGLHSRYVQLIFQLRI